MLGPLVQFIGLREYNEISNKCVDGGGVEKGKNMGLEGPPGQLNT